MTSSSSNSTSQNVRAAALSALLPGLGQWTQGRRHQALAYLAIALLLISLSLSLGRISGRAAEVLFFMLLTLPWWAIQSYDAYLGPSDSSADLQRTWQTVSTRGHDIRFLGALFLLSAINDSFIILMNPEYLLPFFCTKPGGVLGFLTKALSPVLHTMVGYGFLRLRRWALFVYLLYAAYGMTNALVNLTCFGPGRVRNALLITLAGFTAYILWRRRCFQSNAASRAASPL
ncbi:MAG: hypothetical protein KGS09_03935 [Nitrospirae bacterium]|nr:hypothetical protein [Nitrospirota bacterium]MBU6479682.1 hypothetical protein [Nitrospirota bacterium]MDE3042064.1 hypothetical protein [Nitrospirota bacterium]MDE3050666.1 hypothetical protein [Nitrospirota bacterium]MDE3218679.1 hypothetical protein [Nitrospirota bacterium]